MAAFVVYNSNIQGYGPKTDLKILLGPRSAWVNARKGCYRVFRIPGLGCVATQTASPYATAWPAQWIILTVAHLLHVAVASMQTWPCWVLVSEPGFV